MKSAGLVFTHEHMELARHYRDQPPFAAAWTAFENLAENESIRNDSLMISAYRAIRARLFNSSDSAEQAIAGLIALPASVEAGSPTDAARRVFGHAQALACLRDFASPVQWLTICEGWVPSWEEAQAQLSSIPHERAWSTLLTLCRGVLLEDQTLLDSGAETFRGLVSMIHAHGFITGVVEGKDGGSLTRSLQLVQALILAAEVGAHAGLDLWGYEQRGVSVLTAALYPLYYYFYPESWPWEAAVDPRKLTRRAQRALAAQVPDDQVLEANRALYARYGSFLELINRRTGRPVQAVTLVLDELRPIVDLFGGGPVTLTHAAPPLPKRKGLFGR